MIITEIDPINALQAAMNGYKVTKMDEAASRGNIFITATGSRDIITEKHLLAIPEDRYCFQMRSRRPSFTYEELLKKIYTNGAFDQEIDVALLKTNAKSVTNVKSLVNRYTMPSGRHIILLAEGWVVNLG